MLSCHGILMHRPDGFWPQIWPRNIHFFENFDFSSILKKQTFSDIFLCRRFLNEIWINVKKCCLLKRTFLRAKRKHEFVQNWPFREHIQLKQSIFGGICTYQNPLYFKIRVWFQNGFLPKCLLYIQSDAKSGNWLFPKWGIIWTFKKKTLGPPQTRNIMKILFKLFLRL